MKSAKNNILTTLNNRPFLIWGARMTGIGFLRFAKKYNLNAVGFVDSDPSLVGRKINNLPVNRPSMIPALKAKNKDLAVVIAVSTNLSIQSSDQIEKIVKTSPDYLKISLSGYYPETYNSTHTGGNINLVKSNLYKLKYFIEKHDLSIFVEVNYHLYKNNIGRDLNKMKELCDELGFAFAGCYANVTPVERLIDYCEGNLDIKTQEFLKLLLVGIDKGLEITKSYRNLPCRFLTNQVNINWDRSVPLCCVCFDRQNSLISDDYLKESLKDILIKKKNHPLCNKCQAYGLPPYLLGVNQKGWKVEADRKRKSLLINVKS